MSPSSVTIRITPQSLPGQEKWLRWLGFPLGLLKAFRQRVQLARAVWSRRRHRVKAFYERRLPFAEEFMALFGRDRLPDCSTLSRLLAALNQATVEALRTLFQEDLSARKAFASPDGLWDRSGQQLVVVDVGGWPMSCDRGGAPSLILAPSH